MTTPMKQIIFETTGGLLVYTVPAGTDPETKALEAGAYPPQYVPGLTDPEQGEWYVCPLCEWRVLMRQGAVVMPMHPELRSARYCVAEDWPIADLEVMRTERRAGLHLRAHP
jgi:hypothetical protein